MAKRANPVESDEPTIAEQTVIDFLKDRGIPVPPGSVKESTTGKIISLPGDGKLKLIRQEDGWSFFNCGTGCFEGGGDCIEEALEAYYG